MKIGRVGSISRIASMDVGEQIACFSSFPASPCTPSLETQQKRMLGWFRWAFTVSSCSVFQ